MKPIGRAGTQNRIRMNLKRNQQKLYVITGDIPVLCYRTSLLMYHQKHQDN